MATPTENPDFMLLMFGSVSRTILAAAGGYMMAKGIDAETTTAVLGGVTTLATAGWSLWQKKKIVKTAKPT